MVRNEGPEPKLAHGSGPFQTAWLAVPAIHKRASFDRDPN